MNPARRKKLHRLSLAAEATEVKTEEVKAEETKEVVAETTPVIDTTTEVNAAQEETSVESPKVAPTYKKNKKVVETEE